MWQSDHRDGLTLTRCDVCGRRQWCAVEGTAMCRTCCPAAVDAAVEEAREARASAAQRAQEALRQRLAEQALIENALWEAEFMPPSEDEPCDPIPREVAKATVRWPEYYNPDTMPDFNQVFRRD
jgi:hypothetical protein